MASVKVAVRVRPMNKRYTSIFSDVSLFHKKQAVPCPENPLTLECSVFQIASLYDHEFVILFYFRSVSILTAGRVHNLLIIYRTRSSTYATVNRGLYDNAV